MNNHSQSRQTAPIRVSHVGALPRPPGIKGIRPTQMEGAPVSVPEAVEQVVRKQRAHGIGIIGDGEFSKLSFLHYVSDRLSGMAQHELQPGEVHPNVGAAQRDLQEFPGYFAARGGVFPHRSPVITCTGPVCYVGQEAVQSDIRNLKSALAKIDQATGFLTAISPQMIELTMPNQHYANDEEYVIALADALHDEYRAITDAGLILQIDDPGIAHAWQKDPTWNIDRYRAHCANRIELLNYALRDCPVEQVRLHMCWGSYHGPHATDIELRHLIDLLYKLNVGCYSIEGGNPRHEFEWNVFKDHKLPDGKKIMPGVVSHCSDTVEHPELVAQRLIRYAELVGRDNVIAGTDCGMMRVHPEICWAKLDALVAGARLASERL
jgi:5-methyltetrahydropteroyltriglutamate--homocysteine methyltransferase